MSERTQPAGRIGAGEGARSCHLNSSRLVGRLQLCAVRSSTMLSIKNILFPVDFSNRCCGAVPFVDAIANRFGSKITLLSVAQPFWYAGMGDPGGPVMIDTDEILQELKARLDVALVRE